MQSVKKKSATYWKCRCICGKIVTKRNDQLTNKENISCGCKKQKKFNDLTGQKFGRLLVIKPIEERASNGGVKFLCKCDCGVEKIVEGHNLKNHTSQSCGCLAREKFIQRTKAKRKDLTGLVFSKLAVLEDTGEVDAQLRHFWLCRCECGNLVKVRDSSLTSGNTNSCGCHYSKGSAKIQQILQQNDIKFEKEKTFEDLISEKGGYLRYDFYLPDYNRLIEFDGEQHFNYTDTGWNTKENFEKTQKSDKIKNEYALSHKIDLIRIPFTETNKITLQILLNNKYLITTVNSDKPRF